jgi:VanZ family protein
MIADRWRGVGLLVACLGVLSATLHAGLRPYDFFVPNRVAWSEGAPGLRFDRQGIAATSESFDWVASGRAKPVSIEVWLRRGASPPASGGVVLAVGDGGEFAPLLLAQWRSSFYFRFPALQDGVLVEQTLSLKDDFPEGVQRFVALTSGQGGSRAYVEAAEVASSPLAHSVVREGGSLGGRLVLGNRIQAGGGWIGRVDGLALYGRALSREEVAAHATSARKDGIRALAGEPGLLALYAFDEGAGDRVRDLAGGAGDLLIPGRHRPLDPRPLQLRSTRVRRFVSRSDMVVNLLGFVPVGLVLVWALRRWTALGENSLFWLAIFVGFSLSLAIETTQAFLPGRISAAGDLALNTAGSALGALLGRAVGYLGDPGLGAGRRRPCGD